MDGYPTDLTDEQWALVEPLLNAPGKRGRRPVLYVTHTGCQWRCLPRDFGPWTRVWTQFRRRSANGTWSRLLAAPHRQARTKPSRTEEVPSMVVTDTHLARGASNGGATFHAKGGPYGATNDAKRYVAVDVTGLPLAAAVVPASMHENDATKLLLDQLREHDQAGRLSLVKVDRGVTARAARALRHRHRSHLRVRDSQGVVYVLARPPRRAFHVHHVVFLRHQPRDDLVQNDRGPEQRHKPRPDEIERPVRPPSPSADQGYVATAGDRTG